MDMDAEARSRPREPTRPSAGDYDVDELTPAQERKAEGVEAEPGCPAGPHGEGDPDIVQLEEVTKLTSAPHPIPDSDLLTVAFAREVRPTSVTSDFKKHFDDTFGLIQFPRAVRQ